MRRREDGDRSKARAERILLVGELDRIRVRALAWRNGLGALLAGLIGFSLIKGRSDVTELRPSFAVWVGVLLLLALLVGGVAAVLIIRAAHGRPFARSLRKLGGGGDPIDAARWAEIHGSERALWYGVLLSFSCVVLLVGAVGLTWYGPPKDKPRLEIRLIGGTRYCGEVVAVAGRPADPEDDPGSGRRRPDPGRRHGTGGQLQPAAALESAVQQGFELG